MRRLIVIFLLVLSSCGDVTEETPAATDLTIVIMENQFIPHELTASAGETIFFHNQEDVPHRILSESAEGSFDNTGLFASSPIIHDSYGTITIPDTVVSGDVLYFYSEYITSSMSTPDGIITIE